MKFIKILLLILISSRANAAPLLSNDDVNREINQAINAFTFPQQVDEVTQLLSMKPMSVRGLQYVYKVGVTASDLGGQSEISRMKKIMKTKQIQNLCNNPIMGWYKSNFVELMYTYYDKNENFFFDYRITPNDC